MHELSIAQSIIGVIAEQCVRSGHSQIESVNLRIGRASGIMPDALVFAFDAIKTDTIARDAILNIEHVPVTGICNDCGSTFTVEEEYILACPDCGLNSFRITAGREMDIIDIDVS